MPYDQSKTKGEDRVLSAQHAIAKQESLNCPHCHGEGLATVYAPGYLGDPIAWTKGGIRYAARVAAHCCCPVGVFTRDHTDSDACCRIPRVEDILAGRSRWLLADPTESRA